MRLVALSSAFVLSFALFTVSQPAAAAPDKKETGKNQAAGVAKKSPGALAQSAKPAGAKAANAKTAAASPHSKALQVSKAADGKAVTTGKTKGVAKSEASQSKAAGKAAAAKQAAGAKSNSAMKSEVRRAETARHSRGSSALASVQQPQVQTYPDRFATTDTTGSIPANFPKQSSAQAPAFRLPHLFASPDPVMEARAWIGTNPTDRSTLWCARFMNFVLERSGFKGTGSDAAKSFASYGHRVSGPRVGAIAVMTRGKYGGHVGIVSGIDEHGNPIVISGNNYGRKVGESTYPRSRIYAYVMPER